MGYANALALVLLLLTSAVSLLVFKTSSSWVYYEGKRK
jgi:hypothetical protein